MIEETAGTLAIFVSWQRCLLRRRQTCQLRVTEMIDIVTIFVVGTRAMGSGRVLRSSSGLSLTVHAKRRRIYLSLSLHSVAAMSSVLDPTIDATKVLY